MFKAPHEYDRTPLPQTKEPKSAIGTPPSAVADTPTPPGRRPARPAADRPTNRTKDRTKDTAARPAPAKRDAFFDNAKYLAIVLVAIAHAWEPVMDGSRATKALYLVVYSFHMPAFIIISGYFSRSFAARPAQVRRLITGVAVPYVIFEVAYSLFKRYADHTPDHPITLLDPWYLTWFLAALFIWRLTTPIWRALRHPLPIALGIAALASVAPNIGDDLNLQRVLQFLPYFVLGLCLKPDHFQLVRRHEVRLLALPLFAGALVLAYAIAPELRTGWFFHSSSAQQQGAPWWAGPVMTFTLFGCSVLLSAGFLAWVPRRKMWFTVLGAGTICGYLLHGFLVKGALYAGVFDANPWLSSPAGELLVTIVAAGAVTVLCTPPVRRLFRFATEPEMAWAMRRDPEAVAEPAVAAKASEPVRVRASDRADAVQSRTSR